MSVLIGLITFCIIYPISAYLFHIYELKSELSEKKKKQIYYDKFEKLLGGITSPDEVCKLMSILFKGEMLYSSDIREKSSINDTFITESLVIISSKITYGSYDQADLLIKNLESYISFTPIKDPLIARFEELESNKVINLKFGG